MTMKRSTFSPQGNWYKGNTHTHTTVSDGRTPPAELAAIYRNAGYHFLALTDHDVYGIHNELNTDDFLVLPGVELAYAIPGEKGFRQHHIVGLGIPGENRYAHGQRVDYPRDIPPQQLVDMLHDNGNLAIYAHPYWSHTRMEALGGLRGLLGMEIYNNTCEVGSGCGYSVDYYNQLLWDGGRLFCFASDDSHQHAKDYCGGFIVVKAPALTHNDIIDAIRAGSFYASNGPELLDFYEEDGIVHIKCSPCRTISLQTDICPGYAAHAQEGDLTHAEFHLPEGAGYVRVYCEDTHGHIAWSNPICF